VRPEANLSPPAFSPSTTQRVHEVLLSGHWARGPRALELERRFAEHLGVPKENVVATTSATTALAAASHVLFCRDSLSVSPLTWPATYLGSHLYPNWVDVGARTTDPVSRVDIAVELWGRPVSGGGELVDCAHNVLGEGHAELLEEEGEGRTLVYSFAPQKEIPAPSGGLLVSHWTWVAREVRELLSGGIVDRKWTGTLGGSKGLMDDVTAEIVHAGLDKLTHRRNIRRYLLSEYRSHLGEMLVTNPEDSSAHLAIARAPTGAMRDAWRVSLDSAGIAHGHHYPLNDGQRAACPNAAAWSDTVLTLPLHVGMDAASVGRVCKRLLASGPHGAL